MRLAAPLRPRLPTGWFSHYGAIAAAGIVVVTDTSNLGASLVIPPGGLYVERFAIVGGAGAAGSSVIFEAFESHPPAPAVEFPFLQVDAAQPLNVVMELGGIWVGPGISSLRFINPSGAAATGTLGLHCSWYDPAAAPQD